MNKKHIIATTAMVAAIGLAGAYGVQTASAANTTEFSPMIQRMVEKFNLNKDEVSKLVEENRTERQVERKTEFETKLAEAVTAGKITEAQKTAVIAKHDEIQVKRDAIKTQNQAGRGESRDQMEALRTEMEDFLKAQGIDESVMPDPRGTREGGMRMGGGMHRGQNR